MKVFLKAMACIGFFSCLVVAANAQDTPVGPEGASVATQATPAAARVFPHWMAFLGYALAVILLQSVETIEWIPLIFPLWVLLISVYILTENLHGPSERLARH